MSSDCQIGLSLWSRPNFAILIYFSSADFEIGQHACKLTFSPIPHTNENKLHGIVNNKFRVFIETLLNKISTVPYLKTWTIQIYLIF